LAKSPAGDLGYIGAKYERFMMRTMENNEKLEVLLKLAWQRQLLVLIMNHDLGALLNLAWRRKQEATHEQVQEERGEKRGFA
jgi:hypothetical protein